MNKVFGIVNVKIEKINGSYRLVSVGTSGQRFISRGAHNAIEDLRNNSINLGGKRWTLFSQLDEKNRIWMLVFFTMLAYPQDYMAYISEDEELLFFQEAPLHLMAAAIEKVDAYTEFD